MTIMNGLEFQCANSSCLPFVTTTAPDILPCQIHCLRQSQCKATTFQETTCKCQLFNNIADQNSNLQANIQATTMIVISGTRIPLESTTPSTTSSSTSTSSTTTSTTTETKTTSTSTSTPTSTTTTTSTTTSATSTTTTTTTPPCGPGVCCNAICPACTHGGVTYFCRPYTSSTPGYNMYTSLASCNAAGGSSYYCDYSSSCGSGSGSPGFGSGSGC
ncbi:unnamed protein product [Adineta ricciae]|uniref:Apple domain-containing protein n=1 Tax=Adineta ricciae TaxID=249248 RepID=A0A815V1X9_ADIRI|nr:unnamed protein product [Adineta ricciae]